MLKIWSFSKEFAVEKIEIFPESSVLVKTFTELFKSFLIVFVTPNFYRRFLQILIAENFETFLDRLCHSLLHHLSFGKNIFNEVFQGDFTQCFFV